MTAKETIVSGVNKRRVFIALSLGVAACAAAVLVYDSRLGRTMLGVCRVVVENNSGRSLTDVRIVLSTAESTKITRDLPRMRPGEREAVSARTSDLVVDSLRFVLGGSKVDYSDGGLVCPGEEIVLSVGVDGRVDARYTP
jgi:hypothetical protein